jgi:hypothetical protein
VLRCYAPLCLSHDKGILHRVAVLVATDGAGSRHLQTPYLGAVKALNLDSLRRPRGRPYLGGRSVVVPHVHRALGYGEPYPPRRREFLVSGLDAEVRERRRRGLDAEAREPRRRMLMPFLL